MSLRKLITILGVLLNLTACADLFTVHDVTEIPNRGDKTKINARAIHLDAQQRLVIATAHGYCAEPSPDALASYAASLGFDLDLFNQGSGSLAQALKNDAASIGLRTQSITLMRDALYRMCEASNNGHLDKTEVAAFLRRSQDLTAVVLAIEQLTGAVAANQVILSPSAKAGASANLVSNHQLLDHMEKNVEEKEKAVNDAQSNFNTAMSNKDEAENKKNQTEPPLEPSEKSQADETFSNAEEQVKTAKDELEAAQERLKEAKKVRDKIKALRDAALTNTTAETAGTEQFSTVIQREPLSKEATEAISKAVQGMVENVLGKSYTPDVCLSYLIEAEKKRLAISEETRRKFKAEVAKKAEAAEEAKAAEEAIFSLASQDLVLLEAPKIKNKKIKAIFEQGKRELEVIQKNKEIEVICRDILQKDMEKKERNTE